MDTVQLSVAKPLANNDALLKLLQETLIDADKHEKYVHKGDFNQTTKRLVTNIRSNLEQGIKLCIQEQYEPFQVVLSRVQSEFELEKEFYLQRDADQIQKITRLEVHIKKLNADIEKLHVEIDRLRKANDKVHDENLQIMKESHRLSEENRRVMEENRRISLENSKFVEENRLVMEENRKVSAENSKTCKELFQLTYSAARRQVAMNIEHEIKRELFTALGMDLDRAALRGTPLFKLRGKFQKQGKRLPLVLKGTLDLNDRDQWNRFDSIMNHMKEFSRQGAHPTTLDDIPITQQKAIELIEEPFVTCALDDCIPWNDQLKEQAKEMIVTLQAYREPGEKFIKTL